MEEQRKQIYKLLKVWPQASTVIVNKFTKDVLGVKAAPICLEEARQELGISVTEHSETFELKKLVAEQVAYAMIRSFGVTGLKESQFSGEVSAKLKEVFEENTNHKLINQWTKGCLERAANQSLEEILETSKDLDAKVEESETLKGEDRQFDLL